MSERYSFDALLEKADHFITEKNKDPSAVMLFIEIVGEVAQDSKQSCKNVIKVLKARHGQMLPLSEALILDAAILLKISGYDD